MNIKNKNCRPKYPMTIDTKGLNAYGGRFNDDTSCIQIVIGSES